VQGDNGSGKSSLLRLLAGIATTAHGEILWQQQSIHNARDYQQHLHYLGHDNGLKLALTVKENLQLLQQLHDDKTGDIENVLTQLNLTKETNSLVAHLSCGQKRRVALARFWLVKKPLWLLDEPITALDQH
jgi:heme exporter protein A